MLRKRRNTYHIVWRENGRLHELSTGTSDMAEAKSMEQTFMATVQARRKIQTIDRLVNFMPSAPPVPTTAATAAFPLSQPAIKPSSQHRLPMASAVDVGMKHRTLSKEHRIVWEKFCKNVTARFMDELTPTMAQNYMDAHFADCSAKRYNNVLTQLNTVCRSCLVEAGLATSPFTSLIPRVLNDAEHYRPFTEDERDRIFAKLADHPYWLLLSKISYYTGLRLESCRRLSPSMIADGMITIMPGKTARFGRAVKIPVPQKLAEELEKARPIKPETPYCAVYPKEEYFHFEKKCHAFYAQLLDMLDIRDNEEGIVGFHSWRELYATKCSEAGVEDRVLRGMMGHRKQETTDLYNHDIESARRSLDKIEKILG